MSRSPLAASSAVSVARSSASRSRPCSSDRPREKRRRRRAVRPLAHLLEGAIAGAQAGLGRSRVSGEQLDDRLVVRGRGAERQAEVRVGGIARRQQVAGQIEPADHRVEPRQVAQDRRLRLRALANLLAHRLAAADALLGRRRPEPERGCDPGAGCRRARAGRRPAVRARPRAPRTRPRLRRAPRSNAATPRAAARGRGRGRRRCARRPGPPVPPPAPRPPCRRPRRGAAAGTVAGRARATPRCSSRAASPGAPPRRARSPASLNRPHSISAPPISASSAGRRGSSGSSSPETRSSRPIAAGRSLRTSALRPAASSRRHARAASAVGVRVARPERNAISERLLEMVADDLLELAQTVPGRPLEPGSVALVQVGPGVLRQRPVGGVANQRVAEAVGFLAGEVRHLRADQVAADEPQQSGFDRHVERRAGELGDRPAVKHLALDRRAPEDRPLVARKALEPRGEQGMDRRGDRHLGEVRRGDPPPARRVSSASSTSIATNSSAKSALPSAAPAIFARSRRKRRAVEQVRDQLAALRVAERLEADRRRVVLAAPPARARIEQLRPARCRREGSAPRATRRRRARSGRGTSARPSADRRAGRRAAASARAPRTASGPPRRSPRWSRFRRCRARSPRRHARRSSSAFSSPASRAAMVAAYCSPGSRPSARVISRTISASGQ